MKFKSISMLCCTVAVFAFIVVGALQNISLLQAPLEKLSGGEIEFDAFIDEVQNAYKSDEFTNKDFYININGLFASLTGRNLYNEVVKLNNGQLSNSIATKWNSANQAKTLAEFSDFLENGGIEFLYVQAPHKTDLSGENMPVGLVNTSNENADAFLKNLSEKGVETLDLRPILAPDAETAKKYFYNTDHHWNNDGAFLAYGEILSALNEKFPEANIDMSYADESNWETTVYEDRFLGSLGKRVGIYFGGVDDYKLYTPKFETDMYFSVNQKRTIFQKGDFVTANVLKDKYLTNTPDYFAENTYCTYIGGDYPLVQHRNSLVKNGLKVLIIKDSFTLPIQAFLSTAVQEIDVLDPRHFKNISIAEYAELTQPDIVIMMTNPSVMTDSKYYNGINVAAAKEQQKATVSEKIASLSEINLKSTEGSNYTHHTAFEGLSFNTKYTLTVKDLKQLEGDAETVTFALYNKTTKNVVITKSFCFEYDRGENGFEWSFVTPEKADGELEVLMYSGLAGDAGGNHIVATELELFEMKTPK